MSGRRCFIPDTVRGIEVTFIEHDNGDSAEAELNRVGGAAKAAGHSTAMSVMTGQALDLSGCWFEESESWRARMEELCSTVRLKTQAGENAGRVYREAFINITDDYED